MPEEIYPRPISLTRYALFQASHLYALGEIIRPLVDNNHIYIVTAGGTSGAEPTWPTTAQSTVVSGGVTFTEHGLSPGVQYLKYLKLEPDHSEITVVSTFEDQGRAFRLSAATPPQRYELSYDGLTEPEAKAIDDFWNAHGIHKKFTFVEPRNFPWAYGQEGETVTGVRFDGPPEKDHSRTHVQRRVVRLVKYPV